MRKSNVVLLLACFMAVGLLLTGCGGKALSDAFDQATVEDTAENVVAMLNSEDSDGLRAICTQEMSDALTDDTLQQIYEALGAGGTFVEFKDIAVTGTTSDDVDYAVAVVVAEYEDQTFTYTISFNTDMQLAGLYYK